MYLWFKERILKGEVKSNISKVLSYRYQVTNTKLITALKTTNMLQIRTLYEMIHYVGTLKESDSKNCFIIDALRSSNIKVNKRRGFRFCQKDSTLL